MKPCLTSGSARSIGGLAIALAAAGFSFGGSHAVRADNPQMPALQEMVIAPMLRAIDGVGERLALVETTVAAFAHSIVTKQVTTPQICLSDESGAQTCITKAHLDALLRMQVEASRPAAMDNHPSGLAPVVTLVAAVEFAETSMAEAVPAETAQAEQTDIAQGMAQAPAEELAQGQAQSSEPAVVEATPAEETVAIAAAPDREEETPSDQATLDQAEAQLSAEPSQEAVTTEAAAEQSTEIAATAIEPALEHETVQLGTVEIVTSVKELDATEIAMAHDLSAEEPEITGGLAAPRAPASAETVEWTSPPDISAPETQEVEE